MSSKVGSEMDSNSSSSFQLASSSEGESALEPHLHNLSLMTSLRCSDNMHGAPKPYLVIAEQPQRNFRFRYRSEMSGTHGCLLAASSKAKSKTYPTVQLHNYPGKARIRCRLVRCDADEEHPHQLLMEDEQEDGDISGVVGPGGDPLVFPDMGIIYTAKKLVPQWLFNKKLKPNMDNAYRKNLEEWVKNECRKINLNIIRLKFSAHLIDTDEPIPNCAPVFSTPIHNLKSAETNEPKIVRMDRVSGWVRGNDDVFILVEKVAKKNIGVRFVEVDELTNEIKWSENASFTQADVHHQYAIVFKTPAYRDLKTPKNVKVHVELYRPSDGRTSDPIEFLYKADPLHAHSKKRKANPSLSSLSSDGSSGGSLKSGEIPVPLMRALNKRVSADEPMMPSLVPYPRATLPPEYVPISQAVPTNPDQMLGDALFTEVKDALYLGHLKGEPMLCPSLQPPAPCAVPVPGYTGSVFISSEFNKSDIINRALNEITTSDDFMNAIENLEGPYTEYREYMQSQIGDCDMSFMSGLNFNMKSLKTDAARQKRPIETGQGSRSPELPVEVKKEPYSAKYDHKDGIQVNREWNPDQSTSSDIFDNDITRSMDYLVTEFCNLIKDKSDLNNTKITNILQKLMDLRLSNGDTFLHMLVVKNTLSMLQYIVKQIHRLALHSLLNIQNDRGETIIHLALKYDLQKQVAFLCESGCDPMVQDVNGNNALHVAVQYSEKESQSRCLRLLIEYMTKQKGHIMNLDSYNNARYTPVLLAAKYGHATALRSLLEAGASRGLRDAAGRLPLHLAVSGDHLAAVRLLLNFMGNEEVDCLDGNGNTALQMVCCNSKRQNATPIAKLLLEKGARVTKKSGGNECPLKLAYSDKEMLALLQTFVGEEDVEIKSEPEDEVDSAEESSDDEYEDTAEYMSDALTQ